jgi:hypothetical protein
MAAPIGSAPFPETASLGARDGQIAGKPGTFQKACLGDTK